ncbi:EAL and HDOD domain-containing protein [Thiohalorhabdus sp.]|uniref:EAL and HDOD domain-containing protein n=1 Tax=Thiohalorhabdus sp. TaxID=3094134 RepID=UPI002FC3AFC0
MESQPIVARQPIFNASTQVVAYELLYRGGSASDRSSAEATPTVLLDLLTGWDLTKLVKSTHAFVNVTRDLLFQIPDAGLEVVRMVLEIPGDIEVDDELLGVLDLLRAKDFNLALDNFVYAEDRTALLERAHMVKVDVRGRHEADLNAEVSRLRPYGVILLAAKVETPETFQACRRLGFDRFQGFFFAEPESVAEEWVAPNKLQVMELLAKLADPAVGFDELAEVVTNDAYLSYRLLRLVNSPAAPTRVHVDSLERALVLLGTRELRIWAAWLSLARTSDHPDELNRQLMVRARFCENLGEQLQNERTQTLLLLGLLSGVDAVMGRPMTELVERLPLSEPVRAALLWRVGDLGAVLDAVLGYECGDWQRAEALGLAPEALSAAYLNAVEQADELMRAALESP